MSKTVSYKIGSLAFNLVIKNVKQKTIFTFLIVFDHVKAWWERAKQIIIAAKFARVKGD